MVSSVTYAIGRLKPNEFRAPGGKICTFQLRVDGKAGDVADVTGMKNGGSMTYTYTPMQIQGFVQSYPATDGWIRVLQAIQKWGLRFTVEVRTDV